HIRGVGVVDGYSLQGLPGSGLDSDASRTGSTAPGRRAKSPQIRYQLSRVCFVEVEGRHATGRQAVAQHCRQLLIVERRQAREDAGAVFAAVGIASVTGRAPAFKLHPAVTRFLGNE